MGRLVSPALTSGPGEVTPPARLSNLRLGFSKVELIAALVTQSKDKPLRTKSPLKGAHQSQLQGRLHTC